MNEYQGQQRQKLLNGQLFNVFRKGKSAKAVKEKILKLLNYGANINNQDANDDSNTPLHMAVLSGDTEVVEFLISMNADYTLRNNHGHTLLDMAKKHKASRRPEMFKILRQLKFETPHPASDPVTTQNTYTFEFPKNPETSGIQGQLYETRLIALLLLRALRNVNMERFLLGANVAGTGAFDDIIIRYDLKGNTKSKLIFLQAKHKEEPGKGMLTKLENKEKAKYFESYKAVKQKFKPGTQDEIFKGDFLDHDCLFVLYTAADNNFKNRYNRQSYCKKDFLYSKENGEIHEFIGDRAADEIEFFSKFRFYTSQAKQDEVETLTKKEIEKFTSIDEGKNCLFYHIKIDAIYLKYHDLIQKWWLLPDKAPYLTKYCKFFEEAKNGIINEPLLTVLNFLCICKANRTNLEFNMEAVDALKLGDTSIDCVHNIVTNYSVLSLLKVVQLFSGHEDFTFIDLDYVLLNDLEEQVFRELNKTSIQTLIFIAETKIDAFLETLKVLRRSHNIIIVSGCTWDSTFTSKKDELNSLMDFTNISQDELLKRGKAIFQDTLVSLARLVPQEAKQFVSGNIVARILDNQPIEIGRVLPDPKYDDVKGYYIERTFLCQAMIRDSIMKSGSKFYVETDGQTVSEADLNPYRDIVVVSSVDKRFKELCAQFEQFNIHWLTKEKSGLRWQQSHGSLRQLRAYVVEQNEEIQLENITNQIILIAGEPGMGKSTVLSRLAEKIKNSNPTFWVTRIDLLTQSNKFKEWRDSQTEIDRVAAFKFLFRAMEFQIFKGSEALEPENELISNILSKTEIKHDEENTIDGNALFEIQLFMHFYGEGKIALMFDGFDEIDPNYTAEVFKLLQVLKNDRKSRIWVTTRSTNIQSELEENLGTLAYTLKPFDHHDQIKFLGCFWTQSLNVQAVVKSRFNIYVNELLESFKQSMHNHGQTFIRIPLQAKLIAMVFQENFNKFYCSEDQQLSAEHKQKLREKLDLGTLYMEFFRIKFDDILFGEKYSENRSNVVHLEQQNDTRVKILSNHKLLAVHSLFDEEARKQLLSVEDTLKISCLLKKVESGAIVEKTGIVYRIVDGKPIFVHQSFAEYFAAKYVWEKFKSFKHTRSDNIIRSIIKQNFIDNDRRLLCSFFQAESMKSCTKFVDKNKKIEELFGILVHELNIGEGNISAKILFKMFEQCVNYRHIDQQIQKLEVDLKLTLFRVSCEKGYAKLVEHFLGLHDFEDCLKRIDKTRKKHGPLYLALKNNQAEVIKILLSQRDDIFSMYRGDPKIIHLAAEKGNTETVERLLNIGVEIETRGRENTTVLITAAEYGQTEVVALLLQHEACIEASDIYGKTALIIAAFYDRKEVVALLMRHKANIKATDKNGMTALIGAARHSQSEVVALLLNHDADIEAACIYGKTALITASCNGQPKVVALLLKHGANIEATDKDGKTALIIAAFHGQAKVVALLLRRGANIEATEKNGDTALIIAARHGEPEVVALLLKHGANIEATDKDGKTALITAAFNGPPEVVALLLQHNAYIEATDKDGKTALIVAAFHRQTEIVELLLEQKANIEATDKDGQTALILATRHGQTEVVKLLLQHGANIKATSIHGMTALIAATLNGRPEVVALVLKNGAIIEATYDHGKTALIIAALYGLTNVVELLLQHGANIEATDNNGKTVIIISAFHGQAEVVALLLRRGANTEATDKYRRTPLIVATRYCQTKVVELLLQHAANIEATDLYRRSPLIIAAYNGQPEVVVLLLKHGAYIEATDMYCRTPLIVAARYGHMQVVAELLQYAPNIDATEKKGMTALIIAEHHRHTKIATLLQEHA